MNTYPDTVGTKPEDVRKALDSGFRWTLDEYQSLATRTINPALTQREGIMHAGAGCASDGGEVCGAARSHFFYNKPLDALHGDTPGATLRDNLIEECGDQLWFLAEMATRLGITLDDIARANMAKLLKRYPDKYYDSAAQARADKVA